MKNTKLIPSFIILIFAITILTASSWAAESKSNMHKNHTMGNKHHAHPPSSTMEMRGPVQVDKGIQVRIEPFKNLQLHKPTKMILFFSDVESGSPIEVKKATIVWSMPAMGHDVGTKTATPVRLTGRLRTSMKFPAAGHYHAVVLAKLKTKEVKVEYDFMVAEAASHNH